MSRKKLNPISRTRLRIRYLMGDPVKTLATAFDITPSTISRSTTGLSVGQGCDELAIIKLVQMWKTEVAGTDLQNLDDQEVAMLIIAMVNVQAQQRQTRPESEPQEPPHRPSAFDLPAGIEAPGRS